MGPIMWERKNIYRYKFSVNVIGAYFERGPVPIIAFDYDYIY